LFSRDAARLLVFRDSTKTVSNLTVSNRCAPFEKKFQTPFPDDRKNLQKCLSGSVADVIVSVTIATTGSESVVLPTVLSPEDGDQY
jgi:hypothetical protein